MSDGLLLKGFEVELFTGRQDGSNVGVANDVVKELTNFVTEPDRRNLEYITSPIRTYDALPEALLAPRRRLREWLLIRGLTLLPGSTLSLGDSTRFERSDPGNPYHDLIENSYGTRVVTASVHINLGITESDWLFAALRLVRCEASLLLALSASSPFLDGQLTGHHSQRWHQFPLTPVKVPLFRDHANYIHWIEQRLADGQMRNERHLWTSVRPNGPRRPYDLNRLELRICDLITDPAQLLAITALLELRVLHLRENPTQLDPLQASQLDLDELAALADNNDAAAARSSLDAPLHHWRDGRAIDCRSWITELIDQLTPLAERLGISGVLAPLTPILETGNQAMRWSRAVDGGSHISTLLHQGTLEMEAQEQISLELNGTLG
ncbi:MAG: glutamate--cysteine ligase [Cyanobacteriota bacterium]|nr:glutamate--cysteine ligase [Cyanobacteriota bacterium]